MHTLRQCWSPEHCGGVVTQSAEPTHCTMSTTVLKRDLDTGELCNNIGLVGVSAKWSYVTASPSPYGAPFVAKMYFWHYILRMVYYTMTLYPIPWHYILYHGIIYYTMALFNIP